MFVTYVYGSYLSLGKYLQNITCIFCCCSKVSVSWTSAMLSILILQALWFVQFDFIHIAAGDLYTWSICYVYVVFLWLIPALAYDKPLICCQF
jgi:hypothetical protein